MFDRDWIVRIADILERIHRIEKFLADKTHDDLSDDLELQDSIGFNFIVIGEAARYVPDSITKEYPRIDWESMRSMRNKIAHDYSKINLEIVWKTIQEDLPPMIPILEEILRKYPPKE